MTKLKDQLKNILNSSVSQSEMLKSICETLDREKSYYNWTGFYFKNGDQQELVLGPYVGATTEHTVIPFGKGICGQVALSNQTFLVPDVAQESNYLSCSIATKAEIVVPIIKNGENIGQIDIDSHYPDPFTSQDQELLEWLCEELAQVL